MIAPTGADFKGGDFPEHPISGLAIRLFKFIHWALQLATGARERHRRDMARSGLRTNRMSMNISELSDRIAEDGTLSKAEVKRLVEAVLKAIVDTAIEGGETS